MAQMTDEIVITEHAEKRAKERLSWNKSALQRMAQTAYKDGKGHSYYTGRMRKYLNSVYLSYKKANNIKIHGEVLYLFNGNTLITLYQIPKKLKKFTKL
jgi:hypothetical protein